MSLLCFSTVTLASARRRFHSCIIKPESSVFSYLSLDHAPNHLPVLQAAGLNLPPDAKNRFFLGMMITTLTAKILSFLSPTFLFDSDDTGSPE